MVVVLEIVDELTMSLNPKIKTYALERTRSKRWRAGTRRNKSKHFWSKKKISRRVAVNLLKY
jgi:hypothetical protein